MDARSDIREFLASRRATITPEQVGLPTYGGRRVPGLRREEVAVVAGVSVPYYTRLERGDLNGVSDSVLDALAGAQQLDDAERAHLVDLARAAQPAVSPGHGLTIFIYTAEPGSRAEEALRLLGSWAARPASREPQATHPDP